MDPFALRSTPPIGVLQDDGPVEPASQASLSEDLAIALYEHMVLARALDATVVAIQREGLVAEYSSAFGEEATIVGSVAAMKDEDWIFPSAREATAALWRGMPLCACAHHVLATARGPGKGRSSPHSPFWKLARVASASSLVGRQIPHAVGLAWAARMCARDVAALVFFDVSAARGGDFHTGFNFAGVARAPVVAVCRNDGGPRRLSVSRPAASAGFAVKALAYGLKGVEVDGGDVVAVLNVVREARQRAAAGLGGTLVEAVVTTQYDHAQAPDLGSDPIARMRLYLESRRLWSTDREQHLREEVQADVDRAVADAAAAETPTRETIFEDVYAELPWHLMEQRDA